MKTASDVWLNNLVQWVKERFASLSGTYATDKRIDGDGSYTNYVVGLDRETGLPGVGVNSVSYTAPDDVDKAKVYLVRVGSTSSGDFATIMIDWKMLTTEETRYTFYIGATQHNLIAKKKSTGEPMFATEDVDLPITAVFGYL